MKPAQDEELQAAIDRFWEKLSTKVVPRQLVILFSSMRDKNYDKSIAYNEDFSCKTRLKKLLENVYLAKYDPEAGNQSAPNLIESFLMSDFEFFHHDVLNIF